MHAPHIVSYTLLVLPPLLLTIYFLAAFPHPPPPLMVHPSLASLPNTSRSWDIYPEDYYPGGEYITLPYGRMRYWLFGPDNGKKIVLIHGLSVPAIIWKDVAPQLSKRGYRVLVYDLYGRGYSDAPQTTYDARLYATQLALLMQHIKWERAHVAGISMGGAIAAAFVSHFPDLVSDRVVLIASAGLMEPADISRTSKVMSSPLVQMIASSSLVRTFIQHLADRSDTAADVAQKSPWADIVRIQSAHLPYFNTAVASSLRDGPIRGLAHSFASPSFAGRRVLVIHGTRDTTVPYKYAGKIMSLLPKTAEAELITVEGGSHDLTSTHSDLVFNAISEFIDRR
ncbi:alpha/beta-hydrolase [Fistulina hepatica ATCC 64428]|uniref:Alpha/beta-hydrolase n=1 Tax=Fistulina hepatica ATCC 64428 TaxID=1128425 RepID=A0A0D7ADT5_9AGAR|nr:alpha/beta-hydrolase [Fistulina hepatica ATCC 64428]